MAQWPRRVWEGPNTRKSSQVWEDPKGVLKGQRIRKKKKEKQKKERKKEFSLRGPSRVPVEALKGAPYAQ
jgi:hypothetical protein